jgi:hypothetical protein
MKSLPIAPFVILAVLVAIAAAFWAMGYLKLRRLRALRCLRCGGPFTVPDLARVKRWIKMDIASGKSTAGYTLHCPTCTTEYRFTEALEHVKE